MSASPEADMAQKLEEGPQIKSISDLYCRGEVSDSSSGEFIRTYVCYIDDDYVSYYGETQVRHPGLSPQILNECLKRIPDEELYPKTPKDITICSLSNSEGLHTKQLITSWNEMWKGTDYLPRLLLGEIETFELLHRNPHPNIVRYHGCKVNRRDRVVGIVMDRHKRRLMEFLNEKPNDFSINSCFEKIESAVKHLHSLGMAHNDLNPYNIMLDDDKQPILIDFASCKFFGERLMEGGTFGWIEEGKKFSGLSEKEHDEFALKKLWTWMEEKEGAVVGPLDSLEAARA